MNTVPPLLTIHLGTQGRSLDDQGFRVVGVSGVRKKITHVAGDNGGSQMCVYLQFENFTLKRFTNHLCLCFLCLQVIINQSLSQPSEISFFPTCQQYNLLIVGSAIFLYPTSTCNKILRLPHPPYVLRQADAPSPLGEPPATPAAFSKAETDTKSTTTAPSSTPVTFSKSGKGTLKTGTGTSSTGHRLGFQ